MASHHFYLPPGLKTRRLFFLCVTTLRCRMSTHLCRVVELMRSACCQTIRGEACLRKAAPITSNALCFHGVLQIHRRTYSLDSLSSGHGPVCQQHGAERMSPSSARAHRNLSAVAFKVGCFISLCWAVFIYLLFLILPFHSWLFLTCCSVLCRNGG